MLFFASSQLVEKVQQELRQTVAEIEANVAYRWFIRYGLTDKSKCKSMQKIVTGHIREDYILFTQFS